MLSADFKTYLSEGKMKYPKKKTTKFIQFAEFDCRQVNLHQGKKWNYWFIEPNTFAIKLPIGEIPEELNGHELGALASFKICT